MSTPNPLIPQGSLQSGGASNVRLAVATVLAIHVVFFGGVLLQGCKRDATTAGTTPTNAPTTALSYPPIDSNSLFYPSPSSLPSDASSNVAVVATPPPTNPTPDLTARAWEQSTAAPAVTPEPVAGKEYTVVRGDNYGKIAKAQGSTVAAIKKANPGVDPAKIRPGMKLTIPVGTPNGNAGASADSSGSYTVKSGDTLTKIAKINGVTVGQLRAANNLKTSRVNIGQKLKIPAPGTTNTKASASTVSTNPTF